MKPLWMLGAVAALACVPAYYFLQQAADTRPEDEFSSWPPTAATIRQEFRDPRLVSASPTQREAEFAQRFQSRFRDHSPAMAVRFRAMPGDRAQLLCPARMEPWSMDQLALTAWREAHEDLGRTYAVDIYETYIGAAPVKVGEVRAKPGHPYIARISYRFPPNLCGQRTPIPIASKTPSH